MVEFPKVNEIAQEAESRWYRLYWLRVFSALVTAFLIGIGLLLYFCVTQPIIRAIHEAQMK